jgi:hypothetical protein
MLPSKGNRYIFIIRKDRSLVRFPKMIFYIFLSINIKKIELSTDKAIVYYFRLLRVIDIYESMLYNHTFPITITHKAVATCQFVIEKNKILLLSRSSRCLFILEIF